MLFHSKGMPWVPFHDRITRLAGTGVAEVGPSTPVVGQTGP